MLRVAPIAWPVALLAASACWQPMSRVDYVVPQPPTQTTASAAMLSAHFSRDAQRDHAPADAIVVVFDRELDATSLVARAFMVVRSDGSRVRAESAVLAPASEADENRSVTLWGDFGEPGGVVPTDVVVIDRIRDEAGGPLLGAAAKVSAYEEGPRLVAVDGRPADAGTCGGAAQIVRTYWSDEIHDVGDDDLAHIDVELADGRTVHPGAFDDTLANGTDTSDDNVLELCVAPDAAARVLRVPGGSFTGPAGRRTGPISATVEPS